MATDNPISLKELIPESGEFTLKATGAAVHRLRPISLADKAWAQEKFGKSIADVLQGRRFMDLCRLCYHQLENRMAFPAQVLDGLDDDGHPNKVTTTGPEALALAIVGPREEESLYLALLKTFGISQPLIDKINEDAEGKKKKSHQKES